MPRAIRHPFPRRADGRPLTIGHRGAPAHAPENTLAAFRAAAQLGADMVELDVRLTADGVPVVSHDASAARVHGADVAIAEATVDALRGLVPALPTLAETIALAEAIGIGLYIEIKAPGAGRAALDLLERSGFAPAALGSFDSAEVADMAEAGSAWPLSVLVRTGEDPIARAAEAKADIAHLCWENASDRPQDLVTPALLEQLRKAGLELVLWHEERPAVLEALVSLPALGICTDQPELLGRFHAE